ncbi:unnamed protein product [Arctogadus glacialis]
MQSSDAMIFISTERRIEWLLAPLLTVDDSHVVVLVMVLVMLLVMVLMVVVVLVVVVLVVVVGIRTEMVEI